MLPRWNHTIDDRCCGGYGRRRPVAVWISVPHDAGRVVLFPPTIMDEENAVMPAHTPGPWHLAGASGNEGEAYIIESAERTIAWTADSLTEDEADASISKEDEANARLIAAAPMLLKKCREYSADCTTRLEVIRDKEGRYCQCSDKSNHDRHCDAGEQIRHWQATRQMVDTVITEAEGRAA